MTQSQTAEYTVHFILPPAQTDAHPLPATLGTSSDTNFSLSKATCCARSVEMCDGKTIGTHLPSIPSSPPSALLRYLLKASMDKEKHKAM